MNGLGENPKGFRRKEPHLEKKISCDSRRSRDPTTNRTELRFPNASRSERGVIEGTHVVSCDRRHGQPYGKVLKHWVLLRTGIGLARVWVGTP